MKTPIITVSNLTEEEFNILYNLYKRKVDKNILSQFYVTSFENRRECFSYSEFMELYKECSLEHIL